MIKANYGQIYYILLLLGHIGLVWSLPYVPTQDGPSHIYNLIILHDLLNGGKEWGNFFSYQLRAVPNLGFILPAYPLLHFFPPIVAERIFLSIYIVLMGVSVPFFLKTFKKSSLPASYFVFPLIFSYTFLMGFYSYIITVPLFLFALSLAWRLRDGSTIFRFFSFNIIAFVLFYFHLIPFIFFLLSLIVIAIVEPAEYKQKISNLLKLLLIMSPAILNLFYYLRFSAHGYIPDFSYLLSSSRFIRLLIELFYVSTVNLLPWQILPASLFMFLIVVLGYHSLKDIYKRKLHGGNIIPSEKLLIYLSLILTLIYFVSPIHIGGGWYFNERFPMVILLISLPLLRMPETIIFKRIVSISVISIVSIFFAFNVAILWRQGNKIEKFLSALHAGLPKGALVMTYKTKGPERATVDILLHASSYYGIFKGCVDIGNYEAASDLFPVHFNKTIPAMPSEHQISYKAETINWDNFPAIQYLFGWDLDNKDREMLSKHFHVVLEKDQFNVWQRRS